MTGDVPVIKAADAIFIEHKGLQESGASGLRHALQAAIAQPSFGDVAFKRVPRSDWSGRQRKLSLVELAVDDGVTDRDGFLRRALCSSEEEHGERYEDASFCFHRYLPLQLLEGLPDGSGSRQKGMGACRLSAG
nr:hypothetical protein SrhCFBP13529_09855 [Stenotrophomonas rhizophila]